MDHSSTSIMRLPSLYGSHNGTMVMALTKVVPVAVHTAGLPLAYSLATAVFGGFTAALATALIEWTGNKAPPGLWMAFGGCGLLATLLICRTSGIERRTIAERHAAAGKQRMSRLIARRAAVAGLAALLWPGLAGAAELRVISSGGFAAAYRALVPGFEQATGNTVSTGWGPSMGKTVDAVPARLARQEPIDVLIMVGYALEDLVRQGVVAPGSRVDLARSGIGVVVRAGARHPDIGSAVALRQALLAARTVAYSDSASGVYIRTKMFRALGIEDEMAGKARMIPATPVGEIVARGEAEIGFQQISELKPIQGIELVGPLPPEVQQVTVFSAGVLARSEHPEAARALIAHLASPAAAAAIRDSGMDPVAAPR